MSINLEKLKKIILGEGYVETLQKIKNKTKNKD